MFHTDRWKEVASVCHAISEVPDELFSEVRDVLISGREQSTVRNYNLTFTHFQQWCKANCLCSLPASPVTVAMYLSKNIREKSVSKSKLNLIFYSINWNHIIADVKNPCEDEWLKMCLSGCTRKIAKPINKKEPFTTDMAKLFILTFALEDSSLGDFRDVTIFILAFAGFFRINEVLGIKRSDIKFYETYCEIYISKSKTDVLREGNWVVIARTGKFSCPVGLLERYLVRAKIEKNSTEFIFRSLYFCKKRNESLFRECNKPLSYSAINDLFKQKLTLLGYDKNKFGLHSFRSGGATVSANNKTSERLFQRHGRWKSVCAKNGYVKDTLQDRLSVSLNLDL